MLEGLLCFVFAEDVFVLLDRLVCATQLFLFASNIFKILVNDILMPKGLVRVFITSSFNFLLTPITRVDVTPKMLHCYSRSLS